jgi:carotenoid cleavage dioxygenase
MMHDFQLTENYAVFFDLPMIFHFSDTSAFPIKFAAEHGSRLGIMPRAGTSADVQWFEVEPCFMFHSMNAYEDASGRVVIEGCRFATLWENGIDPAAPFPVSVPWQWSLDPQTNTASEGQLLDTFVDFPVIDSRRQGSEHRMNYGLQLVEGTTTPCTPRGS